MVSPLRYMGSKYRLSKFILSIVPPHLAYVEVFGGSAMMLFRKPQRISTLEVYNDVDSYLVAFFRTLREQPEELQRLLQLTPYSREEHRYCRDTHTDPALTDLERARRVYVTYRQSFAGKVDASWGYSLYHSTQTASFISRSNELIAAAERLRSVQLENHSFTYIVEKYGQIPGNFLYADPPYLPSTRTPGSVYRHEMTEADHEAFLKTIVATPAMAIVSGYHSELYEDYLYSWKRYEKDVAIASSNMRVDGTLKRATEVVWVNHAAEIAHKEQRIPLMPMSTALAY